MSSVPESDPSNRDERPRIDDSFSVVLSSPPIGWSVGKFTKVIKVWNFSPRFSFDKKTVLRASAPGWEFNTPTVVLETVLLQQYLIFEGYLDYQNSGIVRAVTEAKARALWSDSITITITSGGPDVPKQIAAKFFYPDIPGDFIA